MRSPARAAGRALAMRVTLAMLVALVAPASLCAAPAGAQPAQQGLTGRLQGDMWKLGSFSGAYVLDLSTGNPLFQSSPGTRRTPASVEKLYTTSMALLQFGAGAQLSTQLLGTGTSDATGAWSGTLYLRGGGDPTFGSAGFDRASYGTGATIEQLVSNLQRRMHLTAVRGYIAGDESYLDSLRSTIESNFQFDPYIEGALSGLAFNRGLTAAGTAFVKDPARFAAGRLRSALQSAHVRVSAALSAARAPVYTQVLASVRSPRMARLIALTNAPSDNFFAEMLTKDLGATFGTGGTTAAGVAVIRDELRKRFGIAPHFDDGSGLSRDDSTSPREIVTLLHQMAGNRDFTQSLAVAGQSGTLQYEMRGTIAQGRCRGKTGTLHDVASLAGYCTARDGHLLAFAFLANGLGNSSLGHAIEADMATGLAAYNG